MSKKLELEDFIKKHEKILEIIGVFGALTAFLAQLKGYEDFALIPLMIFFLLIIELINFFPEIEYPLKTSVKFLAFEFLMAIFFLGMGYYILARYVTVYYRLFSLFFFLALYSFIAIRIQQKTKLTQWIRLKTKSTFVSNLALFLIIGLVIILVVVSSTLLVNFLSKIYGLPL